MQNNIVFIGGIHGVGKSTVCDKLHIHQGITYLSASELIKWSELNLDPKNKKVNNIIDTQQRLLIGLNEVVKEDTNYLLDGHFCLLNKDALISKIPLTLFKEINPVLLCLVTGNIDEIKKNIELRDNRLYDFNLLEQMQKDEVEHANFIASELNIQLVLGTKEDFKAIQESINAIL